MPRSDGRIFSISKKFSAFILVTSRRGLSLSEIKSEYTDGVIRQELVCIPKTHPAMILVLPGEIPSSCARIPCCPSQKLDSAVLMVQSAENGEDRIAPCDRKRRCGCSKLQNAHKG